jgi:8-oxo-dGTP pyrophosphatase MutT (NUDIX family)
MEPGKTAGEVALQEAWEEAGLVGLLQHDPIGSYVYEKDGFTCHVLVFLLTVTDSVENYPECTLRQRIWLPISQALTRVDESSLRELLRGVAISRAG